MYKPLLCKLKKKMNYFINFIVYINCKFFVCYDFVVEQSTFLKKKIVEKSKKEVLGVIIQVMYIISVEIIYIYLYSTFLFFIYFIFFILKKNKYLTLKFFILFIKNIIKLYIFYLCSWLFLFYMLLMYIDYINEEISKMDKNDLNIYYYIYISSTYIILGKNSLVSTIDNCIDIFNKCQHMDINICIDMDTILIDKSYFINIININEIDSFLRNESINDNYYWNDKLHQKISIHEMKVEKKNDYCYVSYYDEFSYLILLLEVFEVEIEFNNNIYNVYSAYYIAEKNIFMYFKDNKFYYNVIVRNKIFYISNKKDDEFENVLLKLDLKNKVNTEMWKKTILKYIRFKNML